MRQLLARIVAVIRVVPEALDLLIGGLVLLSLFLPWWLFPSEWRGEIRSLFGRFWNFASGHAWGRR